MVARAIKAAGVKQSRVESLVESLAQVIIGYVIAILTQIVVFPWFDMHIRYTEHLAIGLIFLVVSLARSYVLRRVFNHLHSQ